MGYKVTNPLMCTESEAKKVLNYMNDEIKEKGYVTVEEVYNMVFMLDCYRGSRDYAYGWESLRVADVKFNSDEGCFEVRLPVPIAL